MADDKGLEIEEGAEEGKSGGSKMMIIIAVLLIAGGAAAFFLIGGDDGEAAESSETGAENVAEETVKEPPQYVGVPQSITSNLPGASRNRTVQIKMSFMVRGNDAVDAVKMHMPRLKNDVLMLVSQQSADELMKPDGRIALQEKALETVQATLTELVGEPTIEKVLFVSFVMQ